MITWRRRIYSGGGMSRLVCCAVAALLGAVLVVPGQLGAAEKKAATVPLQSSMATRIPASDLTPGYMTYHDGHPSVRGKFMVDAVTMGEALNDRSERPIMIFVLDRARAAANGCTVHADIMFTAMINTPSVNGKQDVVFGTPNEDGMGVMPLGAYHDMERRGCIAVKARSPDDVAAAAMKQDKKAVVPEANLQTEAVEPVADVRDTMSDKTATAAPETVESKEPPPVVAPVSTPAPELPAPPASTLPTPR